MTRDTPSESEGLCNQTSNMQSDRSASPASKRSPIPPQFTMPRKTVSASAYMSPGEAVLATESPSSPDQGSDQARPAGRTRQSNKRTPSLLRIWWRELTACVIMFAMLFAIFGALLPYQGRPLPKWPYNLSINTLISFFITIMKAAILFILAEGLSQLKWEWFRQTRPLAHLSRYDEASRGAWGCIRLLASLKGTDPVATIGAVLVIVSIVLGPLAQQLIDYVNCEVSSSRSPAKIPRSNVYDEHGLHAGADETTPCKDISHLITVVPWNLTSTYSSINDTDNTTSIGTSSTLVVNTTLPSGLHAFWAMGNAGVEQWFVTGINPHDGNVELLLAACDETDSGTTISKNHWYAYVAGATYDREDSCPESLNASWGCQGPRAASCSLALCAKTYTADVKEGKLYESLVSSSTQWNQGQIEDPNDCLNLTEYWYTQADLTCLDQSQKEQLRHLGYNFTDDDMWLPYGVSMSVCTGAYEEMGIIEDSVWLNLSESEKSIVPADCIYQVNQISYSEVDSYKDTYFAGSLSPTANADAWWGESQLLAIFNDSFLTMKSISDVMDNVAESVTIYMRQHGNSNYSKAVSGSATVSTTCVAVRWSWLAFPAAVVFATSMFLLAVLAKSRLEHDTLYMGWKSSILPLVFHGLDGLDKDDQDESVLLQRKEMDQAARQVRIRLRGKSSAIEMD
ncbi:hypothetical protein LTR72_003588 [Exophiala xenobiotica]|uniref:Uncharacterized protein n=1 Tax=Vermiconidia calcicola TaxID=1690605 RepID=A0AAV9QI24_9PEZI|nr:hypothetical protein LTR72_003588 [Exophiala xenobiotica]KAK5537198.1 hypothetical protein LTR23_007586 [Chaetothyriales sp. CCFEE 6169]KAK5542132.1 hypothetical protein LTR25_002017 [Vermiconidia calcicola]KAK5298505.1 hypothetical protein LTR14_002356 [Exophiala xenobiotica]KAK5433901.1 hypothetical protein LTR34_003413 [Exophiala xenobiotica]